MSSQGTPRKFSEKIAIMERKQNEDQEAFTSIMRDVRSITSNSHRVQPVPTASLAPPILYNRNSTSLPNVSDTTYYWSLPQQQQLLQQQQLQQQPQPQSAASPPHPCRSRSPGAAHYHPYKHAGVPERSPPADYNRMECSNHHLQPPEMLWQKLAYICFTFYILFVFFSFSFTFFFLLFFIPFFIFFLFHFYFCFRGCKW